MRISLFGAMRYKFTIDTGIDIYIDITGVKLELGRYRRGPLIFTARALLSRYMPWSCVRLSVRPSVRLSQVGVLLKRLNVG